MNIPAFPRHGALSRCLIPLVALGVALGGTATMAAQIAPGALGNVLQTLLEDAPGTLASRTAPSVALTSPTAGTVYALPAGTSTVEVPVTGWANDSNGTISALEVHVDGTKVLNYAANSAHYSMSWTRTLGIGVHEIKLIARDNSGETATASANITIKANSAPTVALASPGSGASYTLGAGSTTQDIAIAGTASDSDGTVTGIDVVVDGTVVQTLTPNSANASVNVARALGAGTHTVKLVARDSAGGTTSTSDATITIANAPALTPVPITPPLLGNPDAGTLPGELSVTPGGAASYGIAIEVPPGTAGLKPGFSLNYSSQAGNGLVGLGWSLGGLSSVHRCGQTIAQDGVNGRVRFDQQDRLCLDGQRLVLVNKPLTDANYWADDAEFRTEIESFARITAQGAGAARTFKVEFKDGRIATFGNGTGNVKAVVGTVNSGVDGYQPSPKGGALSWAVDTIKDRAGNFITFEYQQDLTYGEHRPSVVRYGGNGLAPHAAVQFVYEARPDTWKRYVDEARNDLRTRIGRIRTYVGNDLSGDVAATGTLARDYALTYERSPTSGRSLLTSLQACARNPQSGASDCLPATTFAFGKPDPAKTPGFVSRGFWGGAPVLTTNLASGWAMHPEYFAFSDFNNDGFGDVLEQRVAPASIEFGPAAQADSKEANPVPRGTMRSQYRYFHNTGSGFAQYSYKLSTGQDFVVLRTGDFDGDGAPDLVVATATGAQICLSPLGKTGVLGAPGSTITFTCDAARPAIGENLTSKIPFVADVVGDGRSALYGRKTEASGTAPLCIQNACVNDANAPVVAVGFELQEFGTPTVPTNSFIAFEQMMDFAGTGKPQDVRWTKPYYVKTEYAAAGEAYYRNKWYNDQPLMVVSRFLAPGSSYVDTPVLRYAYPAYNLNHCLGDNVWDGCAPYAFHAEGAQTADFNGTGYTGALFGFVEINNNNGVITYNKAETTLCLSTGRSFDCGVRKKYSGANYLEVGTVGNFIGDGQSSYIAHPLAGAQLPTPSMQMCRVLGDDTTGGTGTNDTNLVCEPWTLPAFTGAAPGKKGNLYMDLLGTGRLQKIQYYRGDFNASGTWVEDGRWEVLEPIDLALANQSLDRIHQVTNGLGAVSKVEYVDGVAGGIVTRTSAGDALAYPQRPAAGLGKIVKRLRASNGVSAERTVSYTYKDQANDVAGRGSLGFREVVATDEQTGIATTTTYAQAWPHTGAALSSVVSSGGTVLSNSQSRVGRLTVAQANGSTSCTVALGGTVERWDLNGSWLGKVVTGGVDQTDVQYDAQCQPLKTKAVSTGSALDAAATFTTTTVNAYHPVDTANWLIGLPKSTTVTRSQSGDPRSISRSKDFAYDTGGKGWLVKETIQAGITAQKLVVDHDRSNNGFGLVGARTESWTDPLTGAARSRTTSTTFDAKGRYPATVTNAAGHSETQVHAPATGAKTALTGPNGLTTNWTVDGFGRVSKELSADGNETRKYVKLCQGACPLGAAVAQIVEHFRGTDRIAVPEVSYVDTAGHALRKQTWGFDGRAIVADQRYDSMGRPFETDHPRFEGDAAVLASRQTYDILNRPTVQTTRTEQGTDATLTNGYAGMVTTITNAKNQTRTDKRDVLGQVRQTVDALAGVTQFGYDAFGGLNRTVDPNGNVITVEYDDLGRKTALRDPNLGWIGYVVDALGRTRSQTSPVQRAKGQTTMTDYDALDRMTVRMEPDLESHWVYDTATMGKGQLAEAYTGTPALKDYRRLHTYDSLGRPSTTTQKLTDGDYTSTPAFDAWGRLATLTHRRGSDAAKGFTHRYNGYGYLQSVDRNGMGLWTATKQDAANRVTGALLGNGLRIDRVYSPNTGRLTSGMTTTAANFVRLQEGYVYDALGNVKQRTQAWDTSGFTEDFDYDELNRIKTSQVQGQALQSFAYDAAGNMLSKTGVGTYTYPAQGPTAVRPHAVQTVTSIAGTFVYDDNGNMTSGGGRTASWTSFDMPLTIAKGSESSAFLYGPEHQRVKQTRADGTVVLYAGAQEIETKGAQVTVKTYWPMGLGVEIDRPGQATELNWTHVDRLGSPVSITDGSGNLREKLAYDAWGKRRLIDGSATPDSLDGQVDNRGFTNHEMLDKLDLVHMNGRIYEPLLGKFMSGDPILQDPMNGQGYSRYTYVYNNPTNLTDPTGFVSTSGGCVPVTGSNIPLCNRGDDDRALVYADGSREVQRGNGKGITVEKVVKAQDEARERQAQQQQQATSGGDKKVDSKQGGAQNVALTASDIWQSHFAGAGNSVATALVGFANLMIAIGDPAGNAELFGPWQPFEPKSHYFGAQGQAIGEGLQAVSAGRGIGAGLGRLVDNGIWSVPKNVTDKFPSSWGSGSANKKEMGMRWGNKREGVRIDRGDPDSRNPYQRVDHVIVRSPGILGRDGKPIKGSLEQNPEAHIPLSEYMKWSRWNSPN